MCSIYGALAAGVGPAIREDIATTFEKAAERGRDGWGLCVRDADGVEVIGLSPTGQGRPDLGGLDGRRGPLTLIGNRRAEPATEWVVAKRRSDVQPFQTPAGWLYAHNGTIANDRELLARLAR